MWKVLLYSFLLVLGLAGSQFLGDAPATFHRSMALATMIALSFIMIHVGYEFELDKSRPGQYLWDYFVAGTAAALPWIFCALYFVYAMMPRGLWPHDDSWRESLLLARFASPTSAGVLFSMLAAAGLGTTWMFRKARVLAIFDDLDTILLMIPLKILMVGFKWQLITIVIVVAVLLWLAWRFLHELRLPVRWPWVLMYAVIITAASESFHAFTHEHLEVLLPAFVLGCVLARPAGSDPHADDHLEGVEEGPEDPAEQRVSTIVSACFMVLVGLSMPPILGAATNAAHPALSYEGVGEQVLAAKQVFPGWGWIGLHVLAITLISNIGKMFPLLCYRRQASWRQRLALSIGMFPRGEVGAGVLVVSLSYGLGGPSLTVAVLSLALNLLCTGLFILIVKRLTATTHETAASE